MKEKHSANVDCFPLICSEYCLLFTQCVKKETFPSVFLKGYQPYLKALTLSQTSPVFLRVCRTNLENTVGKGDIVCDSAISPFPTVFSTHLVNLLPISLNLKLSFANSFTLVKSKICCLVNSPMEDWKGGLRSV